MSIKPSVVYIKGVHSITGHDTDSDIGFPQLELEKLFEGATIKETTDTAYDSSKKYIHYDSLNSPVAIQDTGHFNCIKNGYYSIANGINHYYTKNGNNYNYNIVPDTSSWAGKWSFSNAIKSKDLYSISPESDRICIGDNYYEKNVNDYIKQDILTYRTYDDSIYVNWNNKYRGETFLDEETFKDITVWKTKSGIIATSGYYLSVDTEPDNTYVVKLLNLTFDGAGTLTDGAATGTLYKLPSDFNFQNSVFYYVKNSNNFEGLKVNQGQCTFTTDPTTDNNFYIYQKGADWSYPNTTGPEYSILARNNVYAGVYSTSSFPLYTEMETMTAYVGDKAKLSVSGTKATLALPGFQWTMGTMTDTFACCNAFNQNVQIPDGVTELNTTFRGCSVFNQNIKIPNSVTKLYGPFCGCLVFNQNILIPNSVTNMRQAFGAVTIGPDLSDTSCPNLNQNILIPNSVTDMTLCFRYCNNLNQPNMYIFSQNITAMTNAFQGCHINNIHIPTSVPKSTSNFMYNCLVNGNTSITFPASNIFNDLPVDIEQWPPV